MYEGNHSDYNFYLNSGSAAISCSNFNYSTDSSLCSNLNLGVVNAYLYGVRFSNDLYVSTGAAIIVQSGGAFDYANTSPDGSTYSGVDGCSNSAIISSGGTLTVSNAILYEISVQSGGTLYFSGYINDTYAVNVNSAEGAEIIDFRS